MLSDSTSAWFYELLAIIAKQSLLGWGVAILTFSEEDIYQVTV